MNSDAVISSNIKSFKNKKNLSYLRAWNRRVGKQIQKKTKHVEVIKNNFVKWTHSDPFNSQFWQNDKIYNIVHNSVNSNILGNDIILEKKIAIICLSGVEYRFYVIETSSSLREQIKKN